MKVQPFNAVRAGTDPSLHIRLASIQAGLLASACSMVPLPIGVAIEMCGLDPVAWTQRTMLERLGGEVAPSTARQRKTSGAANGLAKYRAPARGVVLVAHGAARVAGRFGLGQTARHLAKYAPVIGALAVGIHAYHQTAALGFASAPEPTAFARPRSRSR